MQVCRPGADATCVPHRHLAQRDDPQSAAVTGDKSPRVVRKSRYDRLDETVDRLCYSTPSQDGEDPNCPEHQQRRQHTDDEEVARAHRQRSRQTDRDEGQVVEEAHSAGQQQVEHDDDEGRENS